MDRRSFVTAAAAAGAAVPVSAATGNAIIELRYFRLRNGAQVQRTSDFLSKYYAPALRRAGAGPMGFFNAVVGEGSPFVLSLVSYPTFAAAGQAPDKLMDDKEYLKGYNEYNADSPFMRMENCLLRAFDVQPQVIAPAVEKGHVFELRTYESSSMTAARTKIRMFNQGETAIFKKLGFAPVFFGETLVGRNLPNLMYMTTFESLADRENKWKAFGSDPDWQKMRAIPEYADALIVSNISIAILRPLAFSEIR